MINKVTRDKIVKQALQEIEFARRPKRGRIQSWHKTENMYYAKKEKTDETRANVELGAMQSFVHSLMAKIDNALTFKFAKRKNSQLKKVQRLNALRTYDAKRDYWNMKDIVGKKQAIIYGRTIYAYYASDVNGYKPHLEPVDVYDFLIDPAAGGIDIERANYLGRYGVVKSAEDLKAGVKSKAYFKTEVETLLGSDGNVTETIQEDNDKRNRDYGNETRGQKEMDNKGKYKFWEWFTTYEGKRYYLLLSPTGKTAIALDEWKERDPSDLWPFWTWACFPDLTEFWTPSYAEYVRETMMGQSVSINQLIDNSEQKNKPQRLVNINAVENLAELKYRKNGYIKVKGEFDVNKAVQNIDVPSLDNPVKVYEILGSIQDRNSGVTAGSQGVAEADGKATIYEGNQANAADRFGLLNKSYSFGYERFAQLYENGVRNKLTKKIAVEILGPDGVEIKDIDKEDIFSKTDETFSVLVESSEAETSLSLAEQRLKANFLATLKDSPLINQQKSIELQGKIAGFDEETLRQLFLTDEFGSEEIMSEADRDIERILEGEEIQPNMAANTAYKQRFVDYIQDNQEDIDFEQFTALTNYVSSLSSIIDKNMIRALGEERIKMLKSMPMTPQQDQAPTTVAPNTQEQTTLNSMNTV